MSAAELQSANAKLGRFWWVPLLFLPVVVALAYPIVTDFEGAGRDWVEDDGILQLIYAIAGKTGVHVFFGLALVGCLGISAGVLALHVKVKAARRRLSRARPAVRGS